MNKMILSLFLFIFVFTNILNSQVTQQWIATYNGFGNYTDLARSVVVDSYGNVYVTGFSYGSGTEQDYCTIKYNSAGIQQWVARYNGPGNDDDESYSIAVDSFGNVYVTGFSCGSGTGRDYCTIKYNSAGVQQWVARYNGSGNSNDEAYSIAVDPYGNVYVTGFSYESETYSDYCTIKYNSGGIQQWVSRYSGLGYDKAYSIAVDDYGNVYVTGWSDGSGTYSDYCTIKFNSAGIMQWVARYNGPSNGYDRASSITIDAVGNTFVTGTSQRNATNDDYCTIKYNSAGVQQWVARYNGTGNGDDWANSVAVDSYGNVYVTGTSKGNGTYSDYCTIKYNSAGAEQWIVRYNGPGNYNDWAYSIAVDRYGNVYVTGFSHGSETDRDCCTIKYNYAGAQRWIARYNGAENGSDEAYSISIDSAGNVYVTGKSKESATGDFDYCTIKYTQGVGIKNISTEIPTSFSLEQNYPNPFNATTNIKFSLPKDENVKLIVLDLLGREMATVVNERLQAGTYSVDFDASNLTSGVYFYRITTGKFSDIKKMILVK